MPLHLQPYRLPAKLSASIGVFIANFATLEAYLFMAYAAMTGDSGPKTNAILGGIDSFSYKLRVILAVADEDEQTSKIASALVTLGPRLEEAKAFRNMLAHSLYITSGDEKWSVVKNLLGGRGATKKVPLAADHVNAQTAILADILDELVPLLEGAVFRTATGHVLSWQGKRGLAIQYPQPEHSRSRQGRSVPTPPTPPQSSEG